MEKGDALGAEASRLSTLSDVKAFLHRRQSLFLGIFAGMGVDSKSPNGWEMIKESPSGTVNKKSDLLSVAQYDLEGKTRRFSLRPGVTFTAKDRCDALSSILYVALYNSIGTNLSVEVVDLETDMARENWDNQDYQLDSTPNNHTVLRIVDTTSPEKSTMFVDPTYGQIDSSFINSFLIIPEDEFGDYYRDNNGQVPQVQDVGEYRKSIRTYTHKMKLIPRDDFKRLVALVTP